MDFVDKDVIICNLEDLRMVPQDGAALFNNLIIEKCIGVINEARVYEYASPIENAEWLESYGSDGGSWVCSHCYMETRFSDTLWNYKYCPFCGARMNNA